MYTQGDSRGLKERLYRPIYTWIFIFLFMGLGWFGIGCGEQSKVTSSRAKMVHEIQNVEGILEVDIADDFERKRSWFEFRVRDIKTGQTVQLHVSPTLSVQQIHAKHSRPLFAPLRTLKTGSFVSMKGYVERMHLSTLRPQSTTSVFRVTSMELDVQINRFLSGIQSVVHPVIPFRSLLSNPFSNVSNTPILNTSAPIQRTLAIVLVNLKDKAAFLTDRKRIESLAVTMNNDVYNKATYGLIQFNADLNKDGKPDIFGPYTLQDDSSVDCARNYSKWQREAKTLAEAQGVPLNDYNHILFIVPNLRSCKWAGIANIGSFAGKGPYRASVRTEGSLPRVITHELGHNLGFKHSAVDPNNDGKHNTKVTSEEYGDHSCLMSVRLANFNAPHLLQMGAFDRYKARVVRIKPGKSRIKLYPLYGDPAQTTGPMILYTPYMSVQRMYYFSFKTGKYYDKNIHSRYKTGVSIHTHDFSSKDRTLYVRTLKDQEVFKDPDGLSVKQIKKDPKNAFVELEIQTPTLHPKCTVATPVFTASKQSVTVGLHSRVYFTFFIENKDSKECGNMLFAIEPILPGQYRPYHPRYKRPAVLVAPGQKKSVGVQLLHDKTSQAVVFKLKDDLLGKHKEQTISIQVNVDTSVPKPPVLLSAVLKGSHQVELTWKASQHSRLSGYQLFRKISPIGTFSLLSSTHRTQTKFIDQNIPKKTTVATYYVIARTSVGNASLPSNQMTVQIVTQPPPSPPQTLKAVWKNGEQDALLTWSAPTQPGAGVKEYAIYHQISGGSGFKKVAVSKTLSYEYKALPVGRHLFHVRTVATDGKESKPSNLVRLERKSVPLTSPSKLTAHLEGVDAKLSWEPSTPASEVVEYLIFKKGVQGGAFKQIGRTKQTVYIDKNVELGRSVYHVKAKSTSGGLSNPSHDAFVERTVEEVHSPDSGLPEPTVPDATSIDEHGISGETSSPDVRTTEKQNHTDISRPSDSVSTDTLPPVPSPGGGCTCSIQPKKTANPIAWLGILGLLLLCTRKKRRL